MYACYKRKEQRHLKTDNLEFYLITGVGNSGMFMGAITALQQLFTTNRGFATGVATMGIPLGVLIHPLHTKYFLDTFGVSGVLRRHKFARYDSRLCLRKS